MAAGIGIAIGAGALVAMIVVYGGYQKGVETVATFLRPAIEEALGPSNLPDGFTLDDILRLVVKFSPPAIACSTTLMFAVNLYAAARSAQLSQRLTRSWPDVPSSLVLPPGPGSAPGATRPSMPLIFPSTLSAALRSTLLYFDQFCAKLERRVPSP